MNQLLGTRNRDRPLRRLAPAPAPPLSPRSFPHCTSDCITPLFGNTALNTISAKTIALDAVQYHVRDAEAESSAGMSIAGALARTPMIDTRRLKEL